MESRSSLNPASEAHAVVLFDGTCNLCRAFVAFARRHASSLYDVRYIPLQADHGRAILDARAERDIDSVLLIAGDRAFRRSTAILRLTLRLRAPWNLAYALSALPREMRDGVYEIVARYRKAWFGACACPEAGPSRRR